MASTARARLVLSVGVSLTLAPTAALASFETEVLTAAERDNAVDVHLSIGYAHSIRAGKITREWIQDPLMPGGVRQAIDVKELRFLERKNELVVGLRVGLYHDLELHVFAPIVINDDSIIRFALGAGPASTITGSPNADDPGFTAGTPRYPITDVPQQRFRGGFGDMTFGLAWSPFVDGKDEAWPTLTLKADITAPTGPVRDPTDVGALTALDGGAVGLGMTTFDLSLGVSRRMRVGTPALDPYLRFGVRLPVATASQQAIGMTPPASGSFLVGAEIIAYESFLDDRVGRIVLDLSFETRYTGTGRSYSELSDYLPSFDPTRVLKNRTGAITAPDEFEYADFDKPANYAASLSGARCGAVGDVPCGELNQVEEYVTFGGAVAALLQITEYIQLRGGVALKHDTDHFLTNERVGSDLDPNNPALSCDGAQCSGRVNARNSFFDRATNTCPAGKVCDERSPYFDPRYDAPGRRFRFEENTHWTIFVQGAATF